MRAVSPSFLHRPTASHTSARPPRLLVVFALLWRHLAIGAQSVLQVSVQLVYKGLHVCQWGRDGKVKG